MRLPLLLISIVFVLGLVVDLYLYKRLRHARAPRGLCIAYAVVGVVGALLLITLLAMPKRSGSDSQLLVIMWLLYGYFTVYLPKYMMALFCLAQQLLARITRRRMRGVAITGAVVASLLAGGLIWGATVGRNTIDVRYVEVPVRDLPAAFDGFKIVQLSDIHVGSYGDDTTFTSRLVECVNALDPDIICFTGDIVNRHSSELRPFMGTLSGLDAPAGVWSVMGNHDYGDYYNWPSEATHRADADSLKQMQAAMGWNMLNNSHCLLRRGNDTIVLIGVENIGDAPFPVYGSLGRAYPDIADSAVKVLMTHNPAHWTDSIADNPDANIALTLSGHTHAMQMALGRFSPASMRYRTWGGLYADSLARQLYVNIGTGMVAIPARLGTALPEVTVITLKSVK